jgi:hypothetical protein
MKAKKSATLLAWVGTLAFLLFILPVFYIWIPHIILSSSDNALLFEIGAVRYAGLVPMAH